LGCFSGRLAIFKVSTPFDISAWTCSWSAPSGNVKVRENRPNAR